MKQALKYSQIGIVIISTLLLFCNTSQAQTNESLLIKQRALFIYNLIPQTQWNNIDELNKFKITVLGETPLFQELLEMSKYKTVVGRPIEVENISTIEAINSVQLLYVNKNSGFDLAAITRQIRGKNTLLISENYAFEESMINIVSKNNIFQFELNEDYLNEEDFIVTPAIRQLAITSSQKWQELYKASEKNLDETRKSLNEAQQQVVAQMAILDSLKIASEKEHDILVKLSAYVEQQESEMSVQKQEIEQQKQALGQLQLKLDSGTLQFRELEKGIAAREVSLQKQQASIYFQDSILQTQAKQIEDQGTLLSTQEQTLALQKNQLALRQRFNYLLFSLFGITFVFLFALYRNYKNKKRINQQLLQLNKDKNNLIGVVSHDLRNPIHQIKGLTSLMELDGGENLSASQKEYISSISDSCDRLIDMIKRILDVNAIESKQINILMEEWVLHDVVAGVVQDFRLMAQKKSIAIKEAYTGTDLKAKIDKNYFIQVLENIISNAIKYSESNTEITVRVSETDGKVVVAVKDQGPGISDEDKQKMFGTYQKLTAKPTGGEDSYGLGLSIAKKYIEAMNGTIDVESELGTGSTFIIEFNIVKEL